VLSGFLIGGIIIDTLERDPRWLANFWLRRWMRTLPSYFLFLAVNVLLMRVMYHRWPGLWGSYAVFGQALWWPQPQFFNEAWSLAVEEVFYLLAPLLAMARGRSRARAGTRSRCCCSRSCSGRAPARLRAGVRPAFDAGVRKVTLIRLDAILYGVIATYACRRWAIGIGVRRALAAGGLAIAGVAIWMLASGRVNTDPWTRAAFFSVMPLGLAATLPHARDRHRTPVPAGGARRALRRAVVVLALPLQPAGAANHDLAQHRRHHVARCAAASAGFLVVAVAWAAANYAVVERPIMRRAGRSRTDSGCCRRRRCRTTSRPRADRNLLVAEWSSNQPDGWSASSWSGTDASERKRCTPSRASSARSTPSKP
jgi:peptidoglycan/LPS O-acetylase OafA/YrhL